MVSLRLYYWQKGRVNQHISYLIMWQQHSTRINWICSYNRSRCKKKNNFPDQTKFFFCFLSFCQLSQIPLIPTFLWLLFLTRERRKLTNSNQVKRKGRERERARLILTSVDFGFPLVFLTSFYCQARVEASKVQKSQDNIS